MSKKKESLTEYVTKKYGEISVITFFDIAGFNGSFGKTIEQIQELQPSTLTFVGFKTYEDKDIVVLSGGATNSGYKVNTAIPKNLITTNPKKLPKILVYRYRDVAQKLTSMSKNELANAKPKGLYGVGFVVDEDNEVLRIANEVSERDTYRNITVMPKVGVAERQTA